MTLSIHSPDELIAAVPHLLGFNAEESILFVPLRADLPLARVDLPTTASQRNEVWDAVRGAFNRYPQPGASVAIVCMTHDQQAAELVGHDFAARLASIGIDTPLKLSADATHWHDLDSGDSGIQTESARDQLAATTVLAGRAQPAGNRDALAASLVGDREPVAQLLPETRVESAQSTPRREGPWALGRLQQFHADGVRLTDRDAARLLVAVESTPIRDALWSDISRANSGSHVALWTDLTSRAPDDVRAAPASLLGFAAWQNGNGAMAWCALDQVPQEKPYALAGLVAAAVQKGLHPREWEAAKAAPPQRVAEALMASRRLNAAPLGRRWGCELPPWMSPTAAGDLQASWSAHSHVSCGDDIFPGSQPSGSTLSPTWTLRSGRNEVPKPGACPIAVDLNRNPLDAVRGIAATTVSGRELPIHSVW